MIDQPIAIQIISHSPGFHWANDNIQNPNKQYNLGIIYNIDIPPEFPTILYTQKGNTHYLITNILRTFMPITPTLQATRLTTIPIWYNGPIYDPHSPIEYNQVISKIHTHFSLHGPPV